MGDKYSWLYIKESLVMEKDISENFKGKGLQVWLREEAGLCLENNESPSCPSGYSTGLDTRCL